MVVPLGLIGSFLYHKCPTSTLTASLLVSVKNHNNRMEAKYMNHPMYSAEFEDLCRSTKDKTLEITEEIQKLVGVNDMTLAISRDNYVEMMGMFRMDRNEAARKFDKAAESLGETVHRRGSGTKRRRKSESPPRHLTKRSTRREYTPELFREPSESDDDTILQDKPEQEEMPDDPGAGPSDGPPPTA